MHGHMETRILAVMVVVVVVRVLELVHLADIPVPVPGARVPDVRALAEARHLLPRRRRGGHGDAGGEEERRRVVGRVGRVRRARRDELAVAGGAVQVEHQPGHHRHGDAARRRREASAEEGLHGKTGRRVGGDGVNKV